MIKLYTLSELAEKEWKALSTIKRYIQNKKYISVEIKSYQASRNKEKKYSVRYIIPSDLFIGGYITKELLEKYFIYIND